MNQAALSSVKKISGRAIKEVRDLDDYDPSSVNYCTIQAFKGLEAKAVFLIDIDGFESVEDRQLNYVGMSRAKILLYMYYNSGLKEEYAEVVMKGQDLIDT